MLVQAAKKSRPNLRFRRRFLGPAAGGGLRTLGVLLRGAVGKGTDTGADLRADWFPKRLRALGNVALVRDFLADFLVRGAMLSFEMEVHENFESFMQVSHELERYPGYASRL